MPQYHYPHQTQAQPANGSPNKRDWIDSTIASTTPKYLPIELAHTATYYNYPPPPSSNPSVPATCRMPSLGEKPQAECMPGKYEEGVKVMGRTWPDGGCTSLGGNEIHRVWVSQAAVESS